MDINEAIDNLRAADQRLSSAICLVMTNSSFALDDIAIARMLIAEVRYALRNNRFTMEETDETRA